MSIDYELFDGKSLSSLFKDIYENTEYNRKQLDVLTRELTKFIKDGGIVQRLISAEGKTSSEDEYGLSDEEKQQLLSGIETSIKDIQAESDNIHNKIEKDIKVN